MRCLYCGKELALLKRWTGGGEFCSDAHRQRYQEEYNQLALNRLLQAKPPAKPVNDPPPASEAKQAPEMKAVAETKPAPAAKAVAEPVAAPVAVKVAERPKAKPVYREEPVVPPPPPVVVEPEPEVAAPAEMAGFVVEMPVLAPSAVAPVSQPDLELLAHEVAALPSHAFEPLNARAEYQLETAGLVSLAPSGRASNYVGSGLRERRLEVRDFVRTTPIVEINLNPAGETGLETPSEAMDILIFPHPPQASPALWQEPAVRFLEQGAELGELARLAFGTTGFSGVDESLDTPVQDRSNEDKSTTEKPTADKPTKASDPIPVAEAEPPAPAIAPGKAPVQIASSFFSQFLKEDVPVKEEVAVAETKAAPVAVLEVAAPVPEVIEEIVEQAPPEPDPVSTPLPLTLLATAPPKGKAVQIFSSAPHAVEAQVPRSTSLPLRPAMTFGPAPVQPAGKQPENKVAKPVEKKIEVKSEPKKPAAAPVRPDPRVAAGKLLTENLKRPAVPELAPEPAPKQAAKAVAAVPVKTAVKADARPEKKPELKEPMKLREDPKPTAPLPAPLAAPYPGSSDLGLPRLNLASGSGFLGQLPMVAKIGIVIVLLAGLGGFIAFSSKSGGATTTGAGTVIAGSALPTAGAGWITDWGAEPGVRRTRQISILRSSQTLTDYRIEMEAQIETKAIGWVFRAADPKNFYVTKLEIVKPGLEPTVALVRFAIINGEEQAHAQLPLPMPVRLDTLYKIRFDALGDHFTTYVQDQKVDDWTDGRVKTGGVGFYRERGEDATLKGGMNVVPLMVKR